MTIKIILASSSPYRKELLKRLHLAFMTEPPDIEEQQKAGESVPDMVLRLAEEKARHIAKIYPEALIIGSDQAAECSGTVLGKPGNREIAKEQLAFISNKSLVFHTGLCVLNSETGKMESAVIDYSVTFRDLTEAEIDRYLDKEQPFNCAGSFKSEKFGISLVERMEGDDPTALIGLPLIRLCQMLRNQGISLP